MSITIKNFKVLDVTTGKMQQTGRRTISYLETIVSSKTFIDSLVEQDTIPGTPDTISGTSLVGKAHMSQKYIKIERTSNNVNETDHLYISTKLRITKISGVSSAKNVLCYGWCNSLNTTSNNITWNVLFANFNSQTRGDYLDIDLPDSTLYPELYLSLILINKGWDNRTIVDSNFKICSLPGNLFYYSIDPSKSNKDQNQSHSIFIQASNSIYNLKNRICIAFEDWEFKFSDKDYNDVVISLQDAAYDENNTNDSTIN